MAKDTTIIIIIINNHCFITQLHWIHLLEFVNHDRPCYMEIVSTHLLHANMLQNSKQQNTLNKFIMFDMLLRERQRTAFLPLNQKSAPKTG